MCACQFRSNQLLCYLFCVVIGGGVFPVFGAEPKYEGKSLTAWLKLYQQADADSANERQSAKAVCAIGTNALSQLVKWVASGDLDEESQANNGYQILGPAAEPAVPSLAKLLRSTNEVTSLMAGQCLGHIGAPALPALMAGLTDPIYRVSTDAALSIVDLGTNAAPAIPIFIQQLGHPNHFYRERAADALGKLHIEPDTVVPALARLLQDNSQAARYLALSGLENFESRARPVAPAITVLLTDPEDGIRTAATNALLKIAPEMLTNAPAK